jgi:hypothetical protein
VPEAQLLPLLLLAAGAAQVQQLLLVRGRGQVLRVRLSGKGQLG